MIVTNHKAILELFDPKKQISKVLSPKMLRWSLMFAAYEYTSKYRSDNKNSNADCLSGLPLQSIKTDEPYTPRDVLMLEAISITAFEAEQMRLSQNNI